MDSIVKNNTPNIETLKKVQYLNLQQFLEDVNRNFAIIETSPFYKGLPGNEGDTGGQGGQGIRGSVTLFVRLSNFNKYFKNSITSASSINLDWINLKLKNSDEKILLLQCFDVNIFVHGDIIVLTNTLMLAYNALTETFIDTGIAFNEQSQIINNLDKKIEEYVKFYVDNNVSIKNLKTIFAGYDTYAKNFGENNSVFITNSLTSSSVFSPYIEGYTSTQGVKVTTHRYWGLVDDEFEKDSTGTIVFGSMKKYIDLLMKTTLTDSNETLTSDYAPGVNNIPSAIFLQDTPLNGIMVGWKDNIGKNLRRFGQIFKNEANEFVIQSDAGNDVNTNGADYSSIYLHKDYLKYKKLVKFENNLEVKRDVVIGSNINNNFIKTGLEFTGSNEQIIIGLNSVTSRYKNISKIISLENFKSKVIVTDASGLVLSNYVIEKGELNQNNILDNNKITTHVADAMPEVYNTSVLTTNYFSFLARKINNLINYIGNNFYKKSELQNGTITETIKLGGNLEVKNGSIFGMNINFSGSINMVDSDTQKRTLVVDANTGNVTIGKVDNQNVGILNVRTSSSIFDSSVIRFAKFKNNILVTDNDGNISTSYSLLTDNYSTNFATKPVVSKDPSKILNGIYLSWLVDMIYDKTSNIQGSYYTKEDFPNNSIPNLKLNSSFSVGATDTPIFSVNTGAAKIALGISTNLVDVEFHTKSLKFKNVTKSYEDQAKNYILSVDVDGNVKSFYADLESKIAVNPTTGKLSGGPSKTNEIVTGDNLSKITTSINSLITQIGQLTAEGDGPSLTDYVLKSSLSDRSITYFCVDGDVDFYENFKIHDGSGNTVFGVNYVLGTKFATFDTKCLCFGIAKIATVNVRQGNRFLSSNNCMVEDFFQPMENWFTVDKTSGNKISFTEKEQDPLIDNGMNSTDISYRSRQLLVSMFELKKVTDIVNILAEIVGAGGSGGSSDGNFYTKSEMIEGLSISAKFSGSDFRLGQNMIYSDGTNLSLGEENNRGWIYLYSDVRMVRHTNYPIVSTNAYGQPTAIYTVSTKPINDSAADWNVKLSLHNAASQTILLTTADANYFIKSINVMKDKLVELNSNSGGLSEVAVKLLIYNQMPIGMIIGWGGTPDTIPPGWRQCNGENGTVNLKNGSYIRTPWTEGENRSGLYGGDNNIWLKKENLPPHTHETRIYYNGYHTHYHGYDGLHKHYVDTAGDERLDNARTIRIPKSNIDHTSEPKSDGYDFGMRTDGYHVHNFTESGSHNHVVSEVPVGEGQRCIHLPEYATLIFIQKVFNA